MTVLSDYWPVIVFGLIVILVACWPRRSEPQRPSCYGSAPGPQDRAENDCETCVWAAECLRWRPMRTAPRDGTEFWALSDDTTGDDLPPFVSKCAWHPDAGFCTDEIRDPIAWRPL